MFEPLFQIFNKIPKGCSLQYKFRKNKNGRAMLYIYLDGYVGEHYVRYERSIGIERAKELIPEIINDIIKAGFNVE